MNRLRSLIKRTTILCACITVCSGCGTPSLLDDDVLETRHVVLKKVHADLASMQKQYPDAPAVMLQHHLVYFESAGKDLYGHIDYCHVLRSFEYIIIDTSEKRWNTFVEWFDPWVEVRRLDITVTTPTGDLTLLEQENLTRIGGEGARLQLKRRLPNIVPGSRVKVDVYTSSWNHETHLSSESPTMQPAIPTLLSTSTIHTFDGCYMKLYDMAQTGLRYDTTSSVLNGIRTTTITALNLPPYRWEPFARGTNYDRLNASFHVTYSRILALGRYSSPDTSEFWERSAFKMYEWHIKEPSDARRYVDSLKAFSRRHVPKGANQSQIVSTILHAVQETFAYAPNINELEADAIFASKECDAWAKVKIAQDLLNLNGIKARIGACHSAYDLPFDRTIFNRNRLSIPILSVGDTGDPTYYLSGYDTYPVDAVIGSVVGEPMLVCSTWSEPPHEFLWETVKADSVLPDRIDAKIEVWPSLTDTMRIAYTATYDGLQAAYNRAALTDELSSTLQQQVMDWFKPPSCRYVSIDSIRIDALNDVDSSLTVHLAATIEPDSDHVRPDTTLPFELDSLTLGFVMQFDDSSTYIRQHDIYIGQETSRSATVIIHPPPTKTLNISEVNGSAQTSIGERRHVGRMNGDSYELKTSMRVKRAELPRSEWPELQPLVTNQSAFALPKVRYQESR